MAARVERQYRVITMKKGSGVGDQRPRQGSLLSLMTPSTCTIRTSVLVGTSLEPAARVRRSRQVPWGLGGVRRSIMTNVSEMTRRMIGFRSAI